ncbi:MAG TPA: hypothetical protein VKV27_03865 [Solirubrobacteraceae bacterium]|nr:hypothetical protein [Solirubrobacteraceae bacterium]
MLEETEEDILAFLQLSYGLAEAPAGFLAGLGAEDRSDQRGKQPVLVAASVPQAIPQKMDCAALP